GMDEDRESKPRVAKEVDGVAIGRGLAFESPEQFQQVVDACISPFLPGVSIKRVSLSGNLSGRYVFIVYVPQGATAYQAKDHLYYSRSEFETKSMPDHEVRLRMMRGRAAQACLELCSFQSEPFRTLAKRGRRLIRAKRAENTDTGDVERPVT